MVKLRQFKPKLTVNVNDFVGNVAANQRLGRLMFHWECKPTLSGMPKKSIYDHS